MHKTMSINSLLSNIVCLTHNLLKLCFNIECDNKKEDDFGFTSDFCLKSLIGISCVCRVLEIAFGNSFFYAL